jgi:hypothetical protein
MGKVIICTKLARKLHLSPSFLPLARIIILLLIISVVIRFIIIIIPPTLMIVTASFPFITSWLLVTIRVG